MDCDDLIEQILQEQSSSPKDETIDNKYNVEDILNEPSELDKYYNEKEDEINNIISSSENQNIPNEIKTQKEEIKLQDQIKNSVDIPIDINDPVDITNYIEIEHFKKIKVDQAFHLRNYKEQSNYKVNSLEFEPLNLTKEIYSNATIMYTSMHIKDEYLFLGTSIGDIYIFNIQTEKSIKVISPPKELKKKSRIILYQFYQIF